jgi:hypothetical protein
MYLNLPSFYEDYYNIAKLRLQRAQLLQLIKSRPKR